MCSTTMQRHHLYGEVSSAWNDPIKTCGQSLDDHDSNQDYTTARLKRVTQPYSLLAIVHPTEYARRPQLVSRG